ncbi:YozE family protein [Virgibacillus sp. 179-BFC.A HS]|uniref:YozE family protein n=1 Tax=Tigheibacillus jepli TaxID=3035914 RepID=A0ABU5CHG5_9BACI|nr:YozE family protein [Virgibacillus sp. 179-BFC.A HS]MDY0405750.1 YozE family protein [Virgibacillus sp. 179-BFC.A HS]
MRTFYQFMMTYRGKKHPDDESRLADWMFYEPDFPKHSTSYNEISDYMEAYSPFPDALRVFDEMWQVYEDKK